MSVCVRNGVVYKRHKYRNGVCRSCGRDRSKPLESVNQEGVDEGHDLGTYQKQEGLENPGATETASTQITGEEPCG